MATQSWDVHGEAGAALAAVVKDYGVAALSSPQMLSSLLKDLLPDLPRESSVLVAAAEADVAVLLKDRMTQHVGTGAAIAQAVHLLAERTGLGPEACQWAVRQLADTIGMPSPEVDPSAEDFRRGEVDPGSAPTLHKEQAPTPAAAPAPRPAPDPPPTPPGHGGRVAALVAGLIALVCALTIPLQLVVRGGLPMPYGWDLTLSGLVLVTAAVLALARRPSHIGVGLVFGAALTTTSLFADQSVTSGIGGADVAVSIITAVLALVAAISAAVGFGRGIRLSNLRPALIGLYCLAAIGIVIALVPGWVQFRYSPGNWITFLGIVGSGVTGRYLFVGVVALAVQTAVVLMPALLPPGSAMRRGALFGWLAAYAAVLISNALVADQSGQRAAPALFASWGLWVVAALLSIVLAKPARPPRAASA
jgi:hypothetical protein